MSTTTTSTMTASPPQGVDSVPLAAQIPLASFTLPNFPPAGSHLRSLTLTSDISLQDYQSTHLQPGTFAPEPLATLPTSITHLTLELFSLGFPAPFLTELGKALPNLQSLTLFSCLVDGLSDSSRHDALKFFQKAKSTLKELHVVDSFARVGFWKEIGESFSGTTTTDSELGLKVLEVSYTYRGHHESDFLNRVGGDEWSAFLTNDLLGLSLNFAPPSADGEVQMQAEKPEDQDLLKAQDGILPFASDGRASQALRKKFESASGFKASTGMALKVLNLSMFALTPSEIGELVYAVSRTDKGERELVGLTVSVLLEENWLEKLRLGLEYHESGSAIESLEIVGVPVQGSGSLSNDNAETLLLKSKDKIEQLATACSKLTRLEMSILKSRKIGTVVWEKSGSEWSFQRNSSTA